MKEIIHWVRTDTSYDNKAGGGQRDLQMHCQVGGMPAGMRQSESGSS